MRTSFYSPLWVQVEVTISLPLLQPLFMVFTCLVIFLGSPHHLRQWRLVNTSIVCKYTFSRIKRPRHRLSHARPHQHSSWDSNCGRAWPYRIHEVMINLATWCQLHVNVDSPLNVNFTLNIDSTLNATLVTTSSHCTNPNYQSNPFTSLTQPP